MLEIPAKLPPGALVGAEDRLLNQALTRSGGARFLAREADLIRTDGKITAWREARGAVEAVAATPNTGNSRFDPGPPGAVLCEDGVNCGFALPGFTPEVKAFTVAVIYSSGGEARTLASVFTGQSHNMIFLSESEGRILAKDRQTTIEVSGIDKQAVGQFAAEIRRWRKPEPYKGKGIKYRGEYIFRKEGKKK